MNGTAEYDNGDVYEGSFVDWKKSGKGKLIRRDGSSFEGNFDQGMFKKGIYRPPPSQSQDDFEANGKWKINDNGDLEMINGKVTWKDGVEVRFLFFF